MKRRIALIVTLLSAVTLVVAGCAVKDNPSQNVVDATTETTAVPVSGDRPLPTPGNTDLPGLIDTKGAWMSQVNSLPERSAALQFPPMGNEEYHIHSLLTVYVDGKKMPVPNNIGVSQPAQFMSPVHTHDPSGVIHYEAAVNFPFTLGDVFAIWGVVLTDDQVGGYKNSGDKTVQVFVNGKQIENPSKYLVKDKDNIVVAYGKKDSFPKEPATDALDKEQ